MTYVPSTTVRVLRWANCVALALLGAFSFYVSLVYFSDPTRCVLTVYLCLFGLLGIACELKLDIASRNFGFLLDDKGRAGFFFFVGTLGLSFGIYNTPMSKIIPFILGVFSMFVACAILVDHWCKGSGGSSGGGTEMATQGGKYPTTGPNAI